MIKQTFSNLWFHQNQCHSLDSIRIFCVRNKLLHLFFSKRPKRKPLKEYFQDNQEEVACKFIFEFKSNSMRLFADNLTWLSLFFSKIQKKNSIRMEHGSILIINLPIEKNTPSWRTSLLQISNQEKYLGVHIKKIEVKWKCSPLKTRTQSYPDWNRFLTVC